MTWSASMTQYFYCFGIGVYLLLWPKEMEQRNLLPGFLKKKTKRWRKKTYQELSHRLPFVVSWAGSAHPFLKRPCLPKRREKADVPNKSNISRIPASEFLQQSCAFWSLGPKCHIQGSAQRSSSAGYRCVPPQTPKQAEIPLQLRAWGLSQLSIK